MSNSVEYSAADVGPVVTGTPSFTPYVRKDPKYTDLMVDLETLATLPTASLLSIGAVFFNIEEGLMDEFYIVVNTDSCEAAGLTKSASTLQWWERQSDAARTVLNEARSENSASLQDALGQFREFIKARANMNKLKVWGKGPSFDNAILHNAFGAVGTTVPWKYYNDRCVRTLMDLDPQPEEDTPFQGVAHNALDDAVSQANLAVRILRRLNHRG